MNPFSFSQPEDAQDAIAQVADNPSFAGDAVRFIAGGTNLGWGLRVGFGIGLSLLVYGALGRLLFPVELGRVLRLK